VNQGYKAASMEKELGGSRPTAIWKAKENGHFWN
jgi:hypothetical protein